MELRQLERRNLRPRALLRYPETLFLSCVKDKQEIQKRIREDLNKVHNVRNEFIDDVFLEIESGDDRDWRRGSGLLASGKRAVPPDATKRIWGDDDYFRLFLSHKAEVKKEAAALKDRLHLFGVSCFVAHEDIHPTKTWQDEIEYALATMDGFVALMTENFHESDWTDQEVGFALARSIPMIAVRLGMDPYGFIGKFQALPGDWLTAGQEIAQILIRNDRMFGCYLRALRECPSWDSGNTQAKALLGLQTLSNQQIDDLVKVYNDTKELQGSFAFNGSWSRKYGPGLVAHLNRLGSRQFKFSADATVELVE